jgi:tetratricopeptide (TPR) repeat protein
MRKRLLFQNRKGAKVAKALRALRLCGSIMGFLLVGMLVHAQSRAKFEADRLYKKLAYSGAIPYYQKALDQDHDPECVLRLADCYRLTNQYEKAAEWYQKAVALPEATPETEFYYAHTLLHQKDYRSAKRHFLNYATAMPQDPRGMAFAEAMDHIDEFYRDSSRYKVRNLPFNSQASDFGAFPYNGGVIFASSRTGGNPVNREFQWLAAPFLDLYFVEAKDDSGAVWGRPLKMKGEINTRYHESSFTSAEGQTRAYFTRNNYHNQQKRKSEGNVILLKVYSAEMEGIEGKDIQEFPYNNDDYSMGHPAFSPDGSFMVVVSDKPDGMGGKDLYKCFKEGAGWGKPINLGPSINTPGDEMFPFVHPDGSLYFSSNGQAGLGHLDIFKAAPGWSKAVNCGYPLSSPFDDFAVQFNADGLSGYFSSNRPNGVGDDDIYYFRGQESAASVEVIVMDKVAKLPIENAQIVVKDNGTGEVVEYYTDSLGRIYFPTLLDKTFGSTVFTQEFAEYPFNMATPSDSGITHFKYLVELYNPPPALNVLVIDGHTGEKLPGSKVAMINVLTHDTLYRIADRNARFAIKLDVDAIYDMHVSHDGYLNYREVVNTMGFQYNGDTIIPLFMEKISFNKPIVLENIHYDFDKWFIRQDAAPDLMKVAQLMQDNPRIKVELSSHTDCRGSDEYNRVLSQKRAEEARNFLAIQGIEPYRIVATGYGESRLTNGCDDGVPCTEDQQFANRRTEFTILGYIESNGSLAILTTKENPVAPPVYNPEAERETINKPQLPEAYYAAGNVGPKDGMVYRIQLGTYATQPDPSEFKALFEYLPYLYKMDDAGSLVYYVGDYYDPPLVHRALAHIKQYGFRDAKITTWKDGRMVGI